MKRYFWFFFPFVVGILAALSVWNYLWLPFSNPLGIISDITAIGFNPSNNTLRFAVLLAAPIICLLVYAHFKPKVFLEQLSTEIVVLSALIQTKHKIFSIILLSLIALLFAINSPTFIASGTFDSFHEGESLGPAVSYQAGQIPYKDFVMIHGVYQDPLRSVVAFSLFGKSIGAMRTVESSVKIVTWLLLGIFLLQVFDWKIHRAIFVLACIGVLSIIKALTIMPRDVTTILYLMTFPIFFKIISSKVSSKTILFTASFGLGCLPLLGLGMSVDRGVYYAAMTAVFAPLLYFFFFRRSIFNRIFIMGIFTGICIGFFILGQIIRWNFSGLFEFYFVMMPQYKDLMDGFVYTVFAPRFGIPAIVCAFASYLIAWKFLTISIRSTEPYLQKIKKFTAQYLVEIAILLLALLLYRNALGRADWTHINYSWFGVLLLILVIVANDILPLIAQKYSLLRNPTVIICLIALVVGYPTGILIRHNTWKENFPLGTPDSAFIPEKDKPTINFLRNNLATNDDFLTLTDEAAWYYYLNKPCPIRFNIIIHGMHPTFQQEIVDSLKQRNVKYVLYHNAHWANFTKQHNHKQILPIVMDYIHANFRPFITLNDNELWIKSTTLQASTY